MTTGRRWLPNTGKAGVFDQPCTLDGASRRAIPPHVRRCLADPDPACPEECLSQNEAEPVETNCTNGLDDDDNGNTDCDDTACLLLDPACGP